jgi:hypothetical protein
MRHVASRDGIGRRESWHKLLKVPLLRWSHIDGAMLRRRSVLTVAAVVVPAGVAMLTEIPILLGIPAPTLLPLLLLIAFAAGSIDAQAGLLATVSIGVTTAAFLVPTSRGFLSPLLSLLGQTGVILLLAVLLPLLVRAVVRTLATMPNGEGPAGRVLDGIQRKLQIPAVQGASSALLGSALALLWFGGATVFIASVMPSVGVLDVGPVAGASSVAVGGLIAGLLRIPLTDKNQEDRIADLRSRLAEHERTRGDRRALRRALTALASTALIVLLVSSLFTGARLHLVAVAVLLLAIRAVREGALPEPVAILGPAARDAFRRLRGIVILGVILAVTITIAVLAGTDMTRVRFGYVMLLCTVLLLSRRPTGATQSATDAGPGSARPGAPFVPSVTATLLIAALCIPALLITSTAAAQQAPQPVPGAIGATGSVDYSLTHLYPAEGFGGEPTDPPEERTTSYAFDVTVRDAVVDNGRLRLVVDISGNMSFWEGGDCDSTSSINVIIVDSIDALELYFSTQYSDRFVMAPGGGIFDRILFYSPSVRTPCGKFSLPSVTLRDESNRTHRASQGYIVAYHERFIDNAPVTQRINYTAPVFDFTPTEPPTPQSGPGSTPGATTQQESGTGSTAPNAATTEAGSGSADGTEEAEGSGGSADAAVEGGQSDSSGGDPGATPIVTAATSRPTVGAIPTPATPVPVPPLLALVAPALLAGAAGAAAGASALAGGALGSALSSAGVGAAGGAATSGAVGGTSGTATRTELGVMDPAFRQATEMQTMAPLDLRPVVGLPDVDVGAVLEEDRDEHPD